MNILYIAYSCMPNKGSEEKIGWNIPLEASKHHNVFVVTKEEHRKTIEQYQKDNGHENIKFFYVDINDVYKKFFKGVMYSVRLNIWHRKAYPIVKSICKNENIDIIHQITPIEFRSIGKYADIENTKFVCGPLGGGEFLPKSLKAYAKGNMFVERARAVLNSWYKFIYKVNGKLKKCDYIMFANRETEEYLAHVCGNVPKTVHSDVGIDENDIIQQDRIFIDNKKISIIVAGRLVYRKGHELLLDVLKDLPQDFEYECYFVGEGPLSAKLREKAEKYGLTEKIVFTGRIPFDAMQQAYENADVMIMPSIRETTGSVILESMAKGLPVVAMNRFGASVLLDENSAYLYDGDELEDLKYSLKKAILSVDNRHKLSEKSKLVRCLAESNLWSKKVDFYDSVYQAVWKQESI